MSSLVSIDEMIAKGWGHVGMCGGFSTGKVGGGNGDVFDLNQPEFVLGVPPGITVRPFYIHCVAQAGAITTTEDETEILVAVDSLGLWRGDGAHTVVTPSNLRTDLDKGSMCRVGQAFTGNMTTTPGYAVAAPAEPILDLELARTVMEADEQGAGDTGNTLNCVNLEYQPNYPPVLVGPCSLIIYMGGTVATVGTLAIVQWVEGPTNQMVPAL